MTAKHIADVVRLDFARDWTDDQWAEHDARVAKLRAEAEPVRVDLAVKLPFPKRALDAARAADETSPAIVAIREWADANPDGIAVLAGQAGCGKTVAAVWWALRTRRNVGFLRATELATSSRYDQTERARWLDEDALILDDLGSEYSDAKGNFRVDLDELVDVFYSDRRRLVITTNCTGEEFRDRYGQRVVDRLRECGAWLKLAAPSLRRKP